MPAKVFVDTNLLVYDCDARDVKKQEQAHAWLHALWSTMAGRLSWQVLNEFYVTVTGKLDPGMDALEARQVVRELTRWRPTPVDGSVVDIAWDVQDRYSLSWWDALIVSAALKLGCTHLLSEDIAPAKRIGGMELIDPFAVHPDRIL